MSYYCSVCDKTIKHKSKTNHFKSLFHKEFDRCKQIKLTILNPDINKIDNAATRIFLNIIKNLITIL